MRLAKKSKETDSHSIMSTMNRETKVATVAVCKINRKIAIISKMEIIII